MGFADGHCKAGCVTGFDKIGMVIEEGMRAQSLREPMTISDPFTAAHTITVRVYYEDTDLAGIVYHANYLKFMERARTDYLRDHGIDQTVMAAGADGSESVYFAVRTMDISFAAPAKFDDMLRVETMPVSATGARGVMDQRVMRGDQVLCTARVTVACISASGRPTRFPAKVRAMFQSG